METSLRTVLTVRFSILVLSLIWRAVNWVWLRPRRLEKYLRKQGFSGKSYRILMGDMRESNKMDQVAHSRSLSSPTADFLPRMMPFIYKTILNHGKKCFTWYGPYPNVIIMEPETVREILSRHEVFPKPKIGSHSHVFLSGLLNHEGSQWSKHRSILNPSFRLDTLKNILPAFNTSCKEMLEEWEKLAKPKGTVELDSWTYCHGLARDMLARAAFGDFYKDGIKIFRVQQEQIDLGLQAIRSVYIPGSRFLPTKFNIRLRETEREMRAMFKAMIETKMKEIKGGDTIKNSDLLLSVLASNSKRIKEQGPSSGLTLDDMIDDCKAFYLAGQNVTSSLFVWTLVALSQHQIWQEKARDEIYQVFGKKEPDFDGLSHLKIVTMIIHEVLRLYSPAYFTCRITQQELKLEKFSLPEGVVITLPMLLVHHDRDLWGDDVKEFNPERFANGVANATKGRLSFFPFSSGPRTCIGQSFSMLEAKIFVATILQRFRLELSESYTHAPFPAATTFPQHGAHIIIRKV